MSSAVSDSINKKTITAATATACAKINLTLDVLGKRDDGFHELESLVIGVDLRDSIRITPGRKPGVTLTCADQRLAGPDNLVCRAAEELAAFDGRQAALHVDLVKRIPLGAGMGGGSSDAAVTLHVCNRLWGLNHGHATLATVGARLGSDIPLFFSLPAAVITGRGEKVRPVKIRWSGWVL